MSSTVFERTGHTRLGALLLGALLLCACNATQVEGGEPPPGDSPPAGADGDALDMPGVEPAGSQDPKVDGGSAQLTSFPPYYHPASKKHIEQIEQGLNTLDVVTSVEEPETPTPKPAPAGGDSDGDSDGVD